MKTLGRRTGAIFCTEFRGKKITSSMLKHLRGLAKWMVHLQGLEPWAP